MTHRKFLPTKQRALKNWLNTVAADAFDEYQKYPSRVFSVSDVKLRIAEKHAAHLKRKDHPDP